MNTLQSIISIISKEEKKEFIRSLKKRNKRTDTKNIELFHLLDTTKETINLDLILYGKPAKGAFHALCKRLHDSLIDFIASKNFEKQSSEEMSSLKLVLVSRIFFEQNQPYLAFKTLAKAELIATKYFIYSILNEIYHTQILYAHLNDGLDLQELIKKYQKNKLNIIEEENLNIFYAVIQEELNKSNAEVSDIINRNLKLFNISISESLSYQSLFKILEISNQVAHITRDYYAIFPFIKNACNKIAASERTQGKHLYEHIHILYYLSNTFFRMKNFKESAVYLKKMHFNMSLENRKYYSFFYPQYVLIENLLLIYTGNNVEAIKNLKEFNFENYKNQLVYSLDLKLLLIVVLFLQENFKGAFKMYQNFHHSDNWYGKKTGNIWVIQKNLIEIMILMELDYFDLVASRLSSFRKKYQMHLIEHNELIILEFLKLITTYYYKTEDIYSKEFKKRVDQLLNKKQEKEDIFTISFYAWLKAKTNNSKIYNTCLNHINKN